MYAGVVPAGEFLRREEDAWNIVEYYWTLQKGERGKNCYCENRPSPRSLAFRSMPRTGFMWNTCTNTVSIPLCILADGGFRGLPPGKGPFPVSFHSEETITHPDLAADTVASQMVHRRVTHMCSQNRFVWIRVKCVTCWPGEETITSDLPAALGLAFLLMKSEVARLEKRKKKRVVAATYIA